MAALEMMLLSSLDKVFLNKRPQETLVTTEGFRNEKISFQVAYTLLSEETFRMYVDLEVVSPIAECVYVRQVEHVPVRYAAPLDSDDYYLSKEPGLYPDLLRECGPHTLRARAGQWDSLWIEVDPSKVEMAGSYPVTIRLTSENGDAVEKTQVITILDAELPPQKLIHTKWFHSDCLAEYYHQEVFGEEHWATIRAFIKKAVEGGINMILAPIHTPPLDTRIGTERLTTQLIDITVQNNQYSFDTSKFRRWIAMCKECGVHYYEMAHLYTQWGAKAAPKIMATVDGVYKKIFGWETPATGAEYKRFLTEYIPAIRAVLREEGIEQRAFWHISDEPREEHLEDYKAAKEQVVPLLEGCRIMDALSSYEFYQQGVVEHPVVANNHIDPFIDANVSGLWTYYCCGQYKNVSNMFIAMPSARNRILGVQLFKYRIEGFLQWGFNFYKSQYSDHTINPYLSADGDGFVPAGDTFQVYPGENGQPLESIRMAVTREAMQDLRAFELLASLENHEFVVQLMEEGLSEKITFDVYPHNDQYLKELRRKVNAEIMKRIA